MTLAVLAVLCGVSTPVGAQDVSAMSFEQLTVAAASKTFAAATVNVSGKAAARCVGVLETAEIRIRVDGTAASATVGQVVPVGATVDIRGIDNVRRFSAFRTGGTSGVLPMTCYPSPAENAVGSGIAVSPRSAVTVTGVFSASSTAPTIASGFGTTPAIVASNGTAAFTVNVGTGGTATAGVLTLPAATTGWNCHVENRTALAANVANARTVQTATTTTAVTIQSQTISTGAALAWTASDILAVSCVAY